MDPFAIFTLIGRFFSIFEGFTFTDLADFGPIATLVVGLLGVAWVARFQQRKASAALVALLLLLSSWVIGPTVGLWFLAREFQSRVGSWPQVMVDDPKNQMGLSAHYDTLFSLVNYLEAFSGAWMVVFLTLYFTCRSRFSEGVQLLSWGIVLATYLVFFFDPGGVYTWWLD